MDKSGGQIPFDQYMDLALYAPGLGYYAAGARKFGEAGDFVTAPEISPLFARCLANQCGQILGGLGGGEVLEFGAGSGRLAAGLLAELETLGCLPERYAILEVSPDLRNRQRAYLERSVPGLVDRVVWLERLPEPGFRGFVLANELIDAMPVHRFRIDHGRIWEQYVARDRRGRPVLVWESPAPVLESAVKGLFDELGFTPEDYESEFNMRAPLWVEALAGCLEEGLILLIDYGYSRREFYHPQRDRGTLMCHYRHRVHSDPLYYPGLQDITANVDFTGLATAAVDAGLRVCGFNTQAMFLLGCGLERLLAESDPEDTRAHIQLMQGVKRLTLPAEMGERFKVLGLCRGLSQSLLGFSFQNRLDRL